MGGTQGSVTARCPSARDRQAPCRQRDATPLVLLKEDQRCDDRYGVALQMANDIGPSCKKCSETVSPPTASPRQKYPDFRVEHGVTDTDLAKKICNFLAGYR